MQNQLSETLNSRTFIGLLLAQFTATFNDQAIHMVAVFYAVDMLVRFVGVPHIDEKAVVAIVTACFITPFLLFSSFAGTLGDRFSKRSVIVFWKVAEVGMMTLALVGLLLPHLVSSDSPAIRDLATWSAVLVVATVFLMGLHSTFFVPAKLGAMPEILHPSVLSRGNGLLEGTSFTAQILGTSAGGILYSLLKGEVVNGQLVPGREWMIGALLLGLALLGTMTAILMHRIPAAAPHAKLSWNWWRPLKENLGILWRSKPLTLSVTGIAFCVFMTLFLRQTLLYQGELKKELESARSAVAVAEGKSGEREPTGIDRVISQIFPPRLARAAQESELRVALLFALVGLGVGLGSLVAGFVSGHRVELGLVPIGAVAIVVFTIVPALPGRSAWRIMTCLFGIGFGAGFYLVPLYTLLQHRAPKESKGNVVAASNFLNVLGGIVSVALFYVLTFVLDAILGESGLKHDLVHHLTVLESKMRIPKLLFLTTSILTVIAMFILVRKLPDFFLRSAIWLRAWGHNPLRTVGIENMPLDGPVVLATNCRSFPTALNLIAAVDRFPHVVLVEEPDREKESPLIRRMAERAGLVTITGKGDSAAWGRALAVGAESLRRGDMVALTVDGPGDPGEVQRLLSEWQRACSALVVPVYCSTAAANSLEATSPPRVVFGAPLARGESLENTRGAVVRLEDTPLEGG